MFCAVTCGLQNRVPAGIRRAGVGYTVQKLFTETEVAHRVRVQIDKTVQPSEAGGRAVGVAMGVREPVKARLGAGIRGCQTGVGEGGSGA